MIYLIQTDTILGLVSKDKDELNKAKNSPLSKKLLLNVSSFSKLKNLSRVPNKFKKMVRNSKKTTFIFKNQMAIRVIKSGDYYEFLKKFDFVYSTSANLSKKDIDINWAKQVADVIVYNKIFGISNRASKIFRLQKSKYKKIR